jgi:hypothetical protein
LGLKVRKVRRNALQERMAMRLFLFFIAWRKERQNAFTEG